MYILGFDIGGTKCAVITAEYNEGEIKLISKKICDTDLSIEPYEMLDRLIASAYGILEKDPDRIGISCGGPLDSGRGVIMSPPNLPGWDNVEAVKHIEKHYKVPVRLQNDANACALAEWKFGAGIGSENMVFLTFGTGLGAGLILNGRLYEGTNGNAGEVGHIRLDSDGPVGYRKAGSFEGFCSGGGIAKLGYTEAVKSMKRGEHPCYFKEGMAKEDVSAKSVALAAEAGDKTAMGVYQLSGKYLGRGLSVLIDILNPEIIVIGSVFARSGHLMIDAMNQEIQNEALPFSAKCCRIVPAKLGEAIGDYAAVATALI